MDLAHRQGITVLLDGQGADEVLGGYRPFALWLGGMLRAGRLPQAWAATRAIQGVTGLNPVALTGTGGGAADAGGGAASGAAGAAAAGGGGRRPCGPTWATRC